MVKGYAWTALMLGCAALVLAGSLLLGGCARRYDRADYQAVVDEVNAKYQVQCQVDLSHTDGFTPEQLRLHLEPIAREAHQQGL